MPPGLPWERCWASALRAHMAVRGTIQALSTMARLRTILGLTATVRGAIRGRGSVGGQAAGAGTIGGASTFAAVGYGIAGVPQSVTEMRGPRHRTTRPAVSLRASGRLRKEGSEGDQFSAERYILRVTPA